MSDSTLQSSFTQSNILIIFGFLGAFTVLGLISGNNGLIDIIVLSAIGLYIVYLAFDKNTAKSDAAEELKRELSDFNTIYYVGFALVLMYLYMFISSKITGGYPFSIGLLIGFAWIYLVVLLLVNFATSVFNIPVVEMIFQDMFNIFHSSKPVTKDADANKDAGDKDKDTTEPEVVVPVSQDEVFNISNNLYTYEDAQNICSAYGARLATYDDVEKAYNNGAEWCNYGWSEGQMAYFPTQKATWTELQKSEKRKNNCGRPGINGGFMANPNIKFGVNCFGKKPKASDEDLARLNARQTQAAPLTPEEEAINAKVKYWKDNADKMLVVNSYNRQKWSEY
jgi:hypothetical protein